MKLILIYSLIFLISCSNKVSKIQNKIDDTSDNQYMTNTIIFDRENIISQLRKPGEKTLNINNAFQITIPECFEIIDANQNLIINNDNSQYQINNNLGFVYKNKYFLLNLSFIGNNNTSILEGNETFNLRKVNSSFGNQLNYLKQNYINTPIINQNNVKFSRFISHWATGWSTDYYGLFLETNNNDFNEYQISIHNILGMFYNSPLSELSNINNEIKLKTEEDADKIIKDLEFIENSITLSISDNAIKILNGNIGEKRIENDCILPTVDNLRLRRTPSLTGEIIGIMENKLYYVIMVGEEDEIDSIIGNWVMVMPFNSYDVSWVFNGYTRNATNEEINYYSRT